MAHKPTHCFHAPQNSLLRDAMHKRDRSRRAVASWVEWVSVTFVYCVETAKDTAIYYRLDVSALLSRLNHDKTEASIDIKLRSEEKNRRC